MRSARATLFIPDSLASPNGCLTSPKGRRNIGFGTAMLLLITLGGCEGVQSALDPAGSSARAIATMSWIMFAGGTVIFLLVVALMAYATFRRPSLRAPLNSNAFIIGGGAIFPVVALSALLLYTVPVGGRLSAPGEGQEPVRIEVIGNMWWWEMRYLRDGDADPVVMANELHVPVGRPVEITVTTKDVIHSFWVPNLAGKIDLIPGHVNHIRLMAERAGTYRGQCAEYCGLQHAWMAFTVVAEPPDAFERWLKNQTAPAREPAIPLLERGKETFLAAGCGACHTVRGTPADGVLGPDLTHVGSRQTIGAGALPNNIGTLAGWIADSQQIKPGNRMPSFNQFDGETLRALAAYLESLK